MDTCPSLIELTRQFLTEASAEAWFIKHCWLDGVRCLHCAAPVYLTPGWPNCPQFFCCCLTCDFLLQETHAEAWLNLYPAYSL